MLQHFKEFISVTDKLLGNEKDFKVWLFTE